MAAEKLPRFASIVYPDDRIVSPVAPVRVDGFPVIADRKKLTRPRSTFRTECERYD